MNEARGFNGIHGNVAFIPSEIQAGGAPEDCSAFPGAALRTSHRVPPHPPPGSSANTDTTDGWDVLAEAALLPGSLGSRREPGIHFTLLGQGSLPV